MYTTLQNIVSDFNWIAPEICLTVLLITLLFIDLFGKKIHVNILPIVTIAGLIATLVFVGLQNNSLVTVERKLLYNGFLELSLLSSYLKYIIILSGILTALFTLFSSDFKREEKGEFYYLLIGIILGLHLLVMANNLLMLFISLEMVSIGSYILTIFNFNKNGVESAIKYVLFGAFCTGIMLFGISLWYGLTGNLDLPGAESLTGVETTLSIMVIFMLLSGLFFKISAFPFHIWTPDIYQGAPTPLVAFFSIAPKATALIVVFKILSPLLQNIEVKEILTLFLAGISIMTMTIGNFSALVQKNMRRMFAYSTIGHAGFMFMAIIANNAFALNAILFYITLYLFMTLLAFSLLDLFAKRSGSFDVNNFKGLGLKMPFLGVIFVITMISLTGLPPTAGFYAKLFIFSTLWEGYQVTGQQLFLILLLFGLVNTVVSLFYYLRIPYFLFFKKDESDLLLTSVSSWTYVFITLISLPLIVLFFNPNWVLNVIQTIKL